jgi:hypothetical protein
MENMDWSNTADSQMREIAKKTLELLEANKRYTTGYSRERDLSVYHINLQVQKIQQGLP